MNSTDKKEDCQKEIMRVYFYLNEQLYEGEWIDGMIHYFDPHTNTDATVPACNVTFERIP